MSHIECNKELCTGCLACVTACIDQNYDETMLDAISYRKYTRCISEKTGMTCYKTSSCYHCKDAACMKACGQEAIYRDDRGFVRVKEASCTGCKACVDACPHHMIFVDLEGIARKCHGCSTRISFGMEPACVKVCPVGALKVK